MIIIDNNIEIYETVMVCPLMVLMWQKQIDRSKWWRVLRGENAWWLPAAKNRVEWEERRADQDSSRDKSHAKEGNNPLFS